MMAAKRDGNDSVTKILLVTKTLEKCVPVPVKTWLFDFICYDSKNFKEEKGEGVRSGKQI